MATHSSILAWRIPWTEEPTRPWSIGSQRVRQRKQLSTHARAGSSLLLRLCTSCRQRGLIWMVSHVAEHGLWGEWASVVVTCGLSS